MEKIAKLVSGVFVVVFRRTKYFICLSGYSFSTQERENERLRRVNGDTSRHMQNSIAALRGKCVVGFMLVCCMTIFLLFFYLSPSL